MNELILRYLEAMSGREEALLSDFFTVIEASGQGAAELKLLGWEAVFYEVINAFKGHLERFCGIKAALHDNGRPHALSAAEFGTMLARRYKKDGIAFEIFMTAVKALDRPFLTLIYDVPGTAEEKKRLSTLVLRFFFNLEQEVCHNWVRGETISFQRKLREARKYILSEKKRYVTVFQRVSEPAFVVDHNLCLVDANQAFEKFFGVSVKEQIGKTCCEVIGQNVCAACALERSLDERTSFSNVELAITVAGEKKRIVLEGTFLGGKEDQVEGGIVIIQDVTEKRRIEEALRESEEKYRSLVENVPDVTWRADRQGGIMFISSNVENLCGYSPAEFRETGKLGRIHPDDLPLVRGELELLFSENKRFDVRYRFRHKNGEWIWLHDRAGTVSEKDGILYADGVFSDITNLRRIEDELAEYRDWLEDLVDERTEELRLANEQLRHEIADREEAERELTSLALKLKHSNTELEQFAHVASHDLKEPLLLIVAFSEKLLRVCGASLDEKAALYVERILKAARRMQQLIEGLLQLSRISTNGSPFEPIDLGELLNEVVQDLEERIEQAGGRVDIGPLHTLPGDRVQVRQLFQNIIANALKYRKENENPLVVIRSRIIEGNICEVTVEDNGIGFDERYLERIFKPLEQLHGRDRYEGTGMGLATCEKIVLRHGGEITARSRPDKGATFIVRLPIAEV